MELAKGTRDFPPEEMQLRSHVIDTIKAQFRLFGFEPLETPIIERLDTLTAKMEGSDATDVSKEIFRVEDQGGRELGLRYDLTVPLARYVAMHKDLKLPFRRYEIGRVYRDGPIKLGRYREFIQCDADLVGARSLLADAECINLASAVFAALGIQTTVKVNDRRILDAICARLGIDKPLDVMISLDKLEKVGRKGVEAELEKKQLTRQQIDGLFALVLVEGTNSGKLAFLAQEIGEQVIHPVQELLTYLHGNVEFSPSLARGLAYYTGTIFEAFALESPVKSSLMGGGRYDKLIASLVKAKEDTPAVGISFGIEPICEVLKERRLEQEDSATKVFVIPIGETGEECVKLLHELRHFDVSCAMDVSGRGMTKNIEYASKLRIPFILIVGEKDLAHHELTLKNLKTGDERKVKRDAIEELAVEFQAS